LPGGFGERRKSPGQRGDQPSGVFRIQPDDPSFVRSFAGERSMRDD
jgi:hypothetical protein